MAAVVHSVLEQFNITSRLFCVTTNNASNNGLMRRELKDHMRTLLQDIEWDSDATKIPCMAHVIQLVVKAILKAFNVNVDEYAIKSTTVLINNDATITLAIKKVS